MLPARRMVHLGAAVLLVLSLPHPAHPAAGDPPKPRRLGLESCQLPGVDGEALCGRYEVFENRAAGRGRRIPLRVAVLLAVGENPAPDPLFYFAGGPGASAVESAPFLARGFPEIRRQRDVVLIDQRGTGESNYLECPYQTDPENYLQNFLDHFIPTAGVKECRQALAAQADLRFYTTPHVVDDADEVRAALGYEKINLMGISYGTQPVLVYLRRHPEVVRSAIVMGAAPTNYKYPLSMARDTQAALNGVFDNCAAEAACRKAFPDLRGDLQKVLARLDQSPVRLSFTDPNTGRDKEVVLGRNGFVQVVRYMLYGSRSAAGVPLAVHLAAAGDFSQIAKELPRLGAMSTMSEGFFLSITCTENVRFITEEEIGPAVEGTMLGDFRVRRQQDVCAHWPLGELPPDFTAPVRSQVPVLILSGGLDPTTGAHLGEEVARHLPRSRHLVVADAGHGPFGMKGQECVPRLFAEFIARGSAEGLDVSCLDAMSRPPFVLERACVTFLAVPLALAAVALIASWIPARRAASIDPLETLRCE